jgi:hypothetical protein
MELFHIDTSNIFALQPSEYVAGIYMEEFHVIPMKRYLKELSSDAYEKPKHMGKNTTYLYRDL